MTFHLGYKNLPNKILDKGKIIILTLFLQQLQTVSNHQTQKQFVLLFETVVDTRLWIYLYFSYFFLNLIFT